MTQEQWLIHVIERAFSGVVLGEGIDIYAAMSMDDYGNPDEDRLSLTAEREDWRRVPHEDLYPRFWALGYLDAAGFRFYTPAIMTAIIASPDAGGCLSTWFECELMESEKGYIKSVPFNSLFSERQKAAIVRYLKYVIYNHGGIAEHVELHRCLVAIQKLT